MLTEVNKIEKINWNVVPEADFKTKVETVFGLVSDALGKTLGPYGATTILEQYGEMHITKDGWQVLKRITFDDTVYNNILDLLVNISAQVVIKVGDGSTSSIMAANEILKQMNKVMESSQMRTKEFMTVLNNCVDKVVQAIGERSTKIEKGEDSRYEEIYKMALISTNGDEELSNIIQRIYQETQNPTIQFEKAKMNLTSYEIIEGYKMPFLTFLDTVFVNTDSSSCDVKSPYILLFDHRIDLENHMSIIENASARALSQGRRLVVVAPHYDRFLLDRIRFTINAEMKARGTSSTVYCKVSLVNNESYTLYNDLSILLGASVISETQLDLFESGELTVDECLGECEHISICTDATTVKGLYNTNQNLYEIALNDAISKFKEKEELHKSMNMVNTDLYKAKQRVSKLRCKMGVIYVGGNSTLEKTANFDLVDDAVKACESAFNYGYNIGGNLIIPIVIREMIKNNENLSENELLILDMIDKAFYNVFGRVMYNKYGYTVTNIIDECIQRETCYDLIREEYSKDVINSCYTDIEILKAATSIVSLLVSSNQYLTVQVNK